MKLSKFLAVSQPVIRTIAILCFALLPRSEASAETTLGELLRGKSRVQRPPTDEALGSLARVRVSPMELNGGSSLTMISPERWDDLAAEVRNEISETHHQLTTLLGPVPQFKSSVRLTDQESFHRSTGAPTWTNALYYRGQIFIPLSLEEAPDRENVLRAARHEYTHAVINALSNGAAVGWLDEGFAQWIEGSENPALRPALTSWLAKNDPVPLRLLQGGFTRLADEMVAPAYAQSLFSATVTINTFGFAPLRSYFDNLRSGDDKEEAFSKAFGLTPEAFEERLGRTLKRWHREHHGHNHEHEPF